MKTGPAIHQPLPEETCTHTLDIELQQLAEKLLSYKIGAVVAIEPKTGGILAMASGPDYDPEFTYRSG